MTRSQLEAEEHDQFVHILSHDLKAGLRALSELPLWIEEDLQASNIDVPQDVQDHLGMMQRSAKDMMSLLDGLVHLSRAGRMPDTPLRMTVEQATRQVWQRMEPPDGFHLDTSEASDTCLLPKNALATILKAVLENALHHHDRRNGCVHVQSHVQADRLHITIEDDGPGIPENARSEVFNSLVMLRRREETGRAGLGLTLARKLVTQLGGTISVADTESQLGTAILIDLPREVSDLTEDATQDRAAANVNERIAAHARHQS